MPQEPGPGGPIATVSRSQLRCRRRSRSGLNAPANRRITRFLWPETPPMSLLRLYTRVLELLGKEARLGWILAVANLAAGRRAIRRAGAVRPHRRRACPGAADGGASAWPLLAAWAGFGLFTIVAGAAVALHADRLAHRQRQAVLTSYFEHILQLPLTFHSGTHSGPADEGDAERHRRAVAAVAVVLPRAFRRDHVGRGAAAAVALSQLAACDPAVRALRRLHRADHAGGAQDLRHAERGRGALQRSLRARLRRARQCRAGAELRAHRCRGAGPAHRRQPAAVGADAGAVAGGRWSPSSPAPRRRSPCSRSSPSASRCIRPG